MYKSANGKKIYSITEYIDTETGEIITKSEMQRKNFRINNKNKKTEQIEKYIIIKYQYECVRNEQTRLEL